MHFRFYNQGLGFGKIYFQQDFVFIVYFIEPF